MQTAIKGKIETIINIEKFIIQYIKVQTTGQIIETKLSIEDDIHITSHGALSLADLENNAGRVVIERLTHIIAKK